MALKVPKSHTERTDRDEWKRCDAVECEAVSAVDGKDLTKMKPIDTLDCAYTVEELMSSDAPNAGISQC